MSQARGAWGVVAWLLAWGLSLLGCSAKQDGSGADETGLDESSEGSEGHGSTTGSSSTSSGDADSDAGEASESGVVIVSTGFEAGEFGDESDDGSTTPDLDGGCVPAIDPRRSLIETNPEALTGITMPAILTRAALSSDLVGDPQFTYTRLVDSFATAEAAALSGGSHCDDELVDGVASLNGYPIQCPRAEAGQVEQLDGWFAVAAVNRFDLAAADASDCGEQRLILAAATGGRMFVIFEARIANPNPGCGLAGCRPLVDFWVELSSIDDPVERNHQLRLAFLDGHPTLSAAGFEPFMAGVNLTFGTGQIRSNSLVDEPWTLREFRYVAEDTRLGVVAIPVSANGFGPLWNDLGGHPQGPACRQSVLDNLEGLLVDDSSAMGLSVAQECFAGESREDEAADYATALAAGSGAFEAALGDRLAELGSDLSPVELANRASFASNCMGCHATANGLELGHGMLAPSSLGFVHVDEFIKQDCGAATCFAISPALEDEFLPARQAVLESFLAETSDPRSCATSCSDASPDAAALLLEGPPTTGLPARAQLGRLRERERELLGRLADRTLGGRPRGAH